MTEPQKFFKVDDTTIYHDGFSYSFYRDLDPPKSSADLQLHQSFHCALRTQEQNCRSRIQVTGNWEMDKKGSKFMLGIVKKRDHTHGREYRDTSRKLRFYKNDDGNVHRNGFDYSLYRELDPPKQIADFQCHQTYRCSMSVNGQENCRARIYTTGQWEKNKRNLQYQLGIFKNCIHSHESVKELDREMKLDDSPQQKINTRNWSPEQIEIYENASTLRAESGDQETQLWSYLFTPKGGGNFVDNAHVYNEICSWLEVWKSRLTELSKPERKNNMKRKRNTAAVKDFKREYENPLVITGPTGAGKTSSIYCAAAQFNAKIIEISAAERRNAVSLEQRLGGALFTHIVSKDQVRRNMFTPKKPSAKPNSNFGPQDIRSMFSPKIPTIRHELSGGTHDSPALLEEEEIKELNVQNLVSPSSALSKVSLNPTAHDFSVILVDDCDITYATDSNFWPKLKTMCIESRVPIVFTCTNFLHVKKMLRRKKSKMPDPVNKFLHLCLPDSHRLATRLQAWIAGYTQQNHSISWLKKIIEGCNCDVRATLNALHFQISNGLIKNKDEPAVEEISLNTYLQRISALSQLDASYGKSSSTHCNVIEEVDLDFVPKEYDDSITRSSEIGSAFYEYPSLTSALEPSYRAKQFYSLKPFRATQKTKRSEWDDCNATLEPFKCDLCSYASSQKGNSATHMRIHSGDRSYKCNFCSYSSTQKISLNSHMRNHTRVKSYKCDKSC